MFFQIVRLTSMLVFRQGTILLSKQSASLNVLCSFHLSIKKRTHVGKGARPGLCNFIWIYFRGVEELINNTAY